MERVAAVKVDSYDYNDNDVEKGVNEALDLLGGLDKFINPGDKVLLRPNMVEGGKRQPSPTYETRSQPEIIIAGGTNHGNRETKTLFCCRKKSSARNI